MNRGERGALLEPVFRIGCLALLSLPLLTPAAAQAGAAAGNDAHTARIAAARTQLATGDWRSLAHGAFAAAQHGLIECVPDLRAALVDLAKDPGLTNPGATELQATILAIFDAFVRLRAEVPAEELAPHLHGRTQDAAIWLLGQHPDRNARWLLDAYRRLDGTYGSTWLACGNLLVSSRSPDFVAALLRAPIDVNVVVADTQAEADEALEYGEHYTGCSRSRAPAGFPASRLYAFYDNRDGEARVVAGPADVRLGETSWARCQSGVWPSPHLAMRTRWLTTMLQERGERRALDFPQLLAAGGDLASLQAREHALRARITATHGEWIAACVQAKLLPAEAAEGLVAPVVFTRRDWRTLPTEPLPPAK